MTKKTLGYIELEWVCPSCQARNPGRLKTCQNCGAAMPDGVAFVAPAAQQVDSSAEVQARAEAGPDINCPFCGTRNPADAKICSQCGGDLVGGKARESGAVLGALQTQPAPPIVCPHCGTSNPATATKCTQCGGVLGAAQPAAPESVQPAGKRTNKAGCLIAAALAIVALIVLVLYLSSGGTETVGTVQSVQWTYRIAIEELQTVPYEAWHDELPGDAHDVQCRQRVRYTSQDPVAGAQEVCGTPYIVDTGTGQGRVVQDCVYQVSEDWCRYSVEEWRSTGAAAVASGQDMNPQWPTLSLGSYQRAGAASEEYSVMLLAEDREVVYSPTSLSEYRQFAPGSQWVLTINRLGGVTSIEPR